MYRRTAVNRQKGLGQSCLSQPLKSVDRCCVWRVWSLPVLSRSPESLQRFAVRRLAKFFECPLSNLSDSFTSDAHQCADLLERHRLAALFESVVQIENLALARREILLENPIDEFAHQFAVGALFDLAAFLSRETLAECGCILVGAIDRRVERQLRGRHAPRGADILDAVFECLGDLVVGRFATELLREIGLRAAHANELRVLIQRNANAARLLRQRFELFFFQAEDGIRDEFDALIGIELLDGLEESFVADRDKLGEIEPMALIFFYVLDDET